MTRRATPKRRPPVATHRKSHAPSDNGQARPPVGDPSLIGAWFLGPSAENAPLEEEMLLHILRDYFYWRRNHYPSDRILIPETLRREHTAWRDNLSQTVNEMLAALKRHFPFYSPRYIAHQLSDQTIPAVLGYFAGMLYNPNNVSPEAAPVTVAWELEVGRDMLRMLGYRAAGDPGESVAGWSHLTSGGTVANLESLWVARAVRSFPLAVRHALLGLREGGAPHLKLPVRRFEGASPVDLAALTDRDCLELPPRESLALLAPFTDLVRRELDLAPADAGSRAWDLLRATGRLVGHSAPDSVNAVAKSVILVSGAAHYSIAKAADVLGIGRENVRFVDVDRRFRISLPALRRQIEVADERRETILAVVGVAGTTEEGAVDPIHELAALRSEMEREGRTFWLHIDAAWGGYLRSIFAGAPSGSDSARIAEARSFVSREITIRDGAYTKATRLEWGEPDVCRAFLSFPAADSITVDPHKMGYLQYPSGAVAFQNDAVRLMVAQRAPYIGHHHAGGGDAPDGVGPYIIEGSKPGAAAAAAILSHRMIGTERAGYGQIARASLLATRELFARIAQWPAACRANRRTSGYRLLPLSDEPPDTNILCFVARRNAYVPLATLNALNEAIYRRFTVADHDAAKTGYTLPFFISRTVFKEPEYPRAALAGLLERLEVTQEEYRREGLFVLRCTLMSPYITFASECGPGPEYLAEFMQALHEAAEDAVASVRTR